jgi:hypothetical protein
MTILSPSYFHFIICETIIIIIIIIINIAYFGLDITLGSIQTKAIYIYKPYIVIFVEQNKLWTITLIAFYYIIILL